MRVLTYTSLLESFQEVCTDHSVNFLIKIVGNPAKTEKNHRAGHHILQANIKGRY